MAADDSDAFMFLHIKTDFQKFVSLLLDAHEVDDCLRLCPNRCRGVWISNFDRSNGFGIVVKRSTRLMNVCLS